MTRPATTTTTTAAQTTTANSIGTASPKRSILVANAGSGKTWTLANRVLAWCFDERRAGRTPRPAAILAVTFTRKAAGEILARILTHAAQGAEDSASGAKARKEFSSVVGPGEATDYLAVLEALCRDLHRMQIGTIDGYFHRIATAMPDEAGLPPDWTVGEDRDIELLRAEAAARVLADPNAAELISLLEEGAPKASVLASITGLMGGSSVSVLDLYRACSIGGDAGLKRAWDWISRIPLGSDVAGDDADTHYQRACDRWKALEIPMTADKRAPKPRSSWAKAHRVILEALERRDFRKLAAQGILQRLDRSEPYDRYSPPQAWIDAFALIRPHLRAGLLAQARRRMEGALEVMPLADAALRELQVDRGTFTFGDVGLGVARAALREGSRVSNPSILRSALGADIADLAIDEAQDTSAEQFAALRPLIEDVLAVERLPDGTIARRSDLPLEAQRGRFLVVGDPKQSIYGWRGGTPGLVHEMQKRYAIALEDDAPLRKSYRSSKLLMDFVNRVFSNLVDDVVPMVEDAEHRQPLLSIGEFVAREQLPAEVTESAFVRALTEWRFEPHEAHDLKLSGSVHAYVYGKAKSVSDGEGADGQPGVADAGERDKRERDNREREKRDGDRGDWGKEGAGESASVTAAERAASVAARLHRAHPDRTIGILVRTNRVANDVIEALRMQGVPASDEGRATLLDSPAVVGLIQCLRLIDQPGDRIAHFLASRGPIVSITGLSPLESAPSLAEALRDAVRFATELRSRIADEGLAKVLRGFVDQLAAQGLSGRDRGRLERMVAIAEDLAAEPPARLAGFIEAIANDEADASSADRIRVMTVHASKGLEFDDVILASLDDAWGGAPTDWASLSSDPTKPPQMVGPLGNADVRYWVPELAVLERDERRRRLLDDVSLFYVAVTRAREGLHLIVSNDPSGTLPTAAKLIAAALQRTVDTQDALAGAPPFAETRTNAAHDQSDPFWSVSYELDSREHATTASKHSTDMKTAAPTPPREEAPLVEIVATSGGRARPPSSHDAIALWSDDPFTNPDIPIRGVLVHECFREFRSIEDIAAAASSTPPQLAEFIARAAERAAVEKGVPVPASMVTEATQLLLRIVQGVGRSGSIAEALRASPSDEVRNEHPFLREIAVDNAPSVVTAGRIDRLVLHRDASGKVHRATILDYKTGAVGISDAVLESKLIGYRAQMRAYCAAVEELWSLPSGAAVAKLLFVDRDEVLEVTAQNELAAAGREQCK